ncbi:bifunctional DNA primase/polymerase [Promicromonospora sp. NPDC057138]|uniref:bifunctional DNA primase/polymerase n=1 Tax=Promicromonospora sp. NPDC057138 TaxID=3346031 RepID=UPI00362BC575
MDTTQELELAPLTALRRAARAPGNAEAARELAASGVPVFPCVQGSARPLDVGGPRVGSSAPDRVEWWWTQHPTANIAVPTGAASGLDVLEVHLTRESRAGLDQVRGAVRASLLPRPSLVMTTPSGGLHLFFPHSPQTAQWSWAAPGSGVAFHGDRGYVVVPPSLVQRPDGTVARYQLIRPARTPAATVDALAPNRHLAPSPAQPASPALAPAAPAGRGARAAPAPATRAAISGVRALTRPDPMTSSDGSRRRPTEEVSL